MPAEGSQNSTLGGAVSINGAREQANNFLLDGVDNNDLYINQIVVPPALDSVQEFKIQSGSYNAEYGRSAGGQFNVVTKSGTNAWHGSGYGYFRDESLDARNYFDDPGLPIPEFGRQQFGATVGGPLRENRLFVFGNYEGTRVDKAYTRVATVPPLAWRQGDFSNLLTGRVNPATGMDYGQLFNPYTRLPFFGNLSRPQYIDPAGQSILGFYPAPDDRSASSPTTAMVAPVGRDRIDQSTVKVDYSAGADRMFARFSYWKQDRFNPFDLLTDPTNVPGFGSSNENLGQNLAIGWTRPIGSRALNDLRVGWNRLHAGTFQENVGNDVSSALGIHGLPTQSHQVGRPGVIVGITDALIEPINAPQDRADATLQITESVSWVHGDHTLEGGRGGASPARQVVPGHRDTRAVHLRRHHGQPHRRRADRPSLRRDSSEPGDQHAARPAHHVVQRLLAGRLAADRRPDDQRRSEVRVQPARVRHAGSILGPGPDEPPGRVPAGRRQRPAALRLRGRHQQRRAAPWRRVAPARFDPHLRSCGVRSVLRRGDHRDDA